MSLRRWRPALSFGFLVLEQQWMSDGATAGIKRLRQ